MADQVSKPRAFNSAYPGSMFDREDGEYISRDDPASLAAAILETIAARDRQIEDMEAATASNAAEVADLRRLIADDAYACTFQTFGQYRTALLKAFDDALKGDKP